MEQREPLSDEEKILLTAIADRESVPDKELYTALCKAYKDLPKVWEVTPKIRMALFEWATERFGEEGKVAFIAAAVGYLAARRLNKDIF
ncbi:MAG: hypothetical protein PHI12_08330 [Dehalococcoidales bacterium]|nr:hypothetical protein [Dehalococcoidales bacterium]